MILRAIALALASSVDNLAVGVSLGIAGTSKSRMLLVNVVIASCNALGASVAAFGGSMLGKGVPVVAPGIALLAFAYLTWQEGRSWLLDEESSLATMVSNDAMLSLAVPMTLNNLAGGVAGGVAGIGPIMAGGLALAASFAMMAGGHFLGRQLGGSLPVDPRAAAAAIFAALALMQAADVVPILLGLPQRALLHWKWHTSSHTRPHPK